MTSTPKLNSVFFQKIWPAQLSLLQLSYKTRQMISWVVLTNFPVPTRLHCKYRLAHSLQRITDWTVILTQFRFRLFISLLYSGVAFPLNQRFVSLSTIGKLEKAIWVFNCLGKPGCLWQYWKFLQLLQNHVFDGCFFHVFMGKKSTKLEFLHIVQSAL